GGLNNTVSRDSDEVEESSNESSSEGGLNNTVSRDNDEVEESSNEGSSEGGLNSTVSRDPEPTIISHNPAGKPLPSIPQYPAIQPPAIPETRIDTGSNRITDATELAPSATQDIIDRVSATDPTDIFKVKSQNLKGAELSVMSGELSVSYVTPTGQVLGTQVLQRGSHHLEAPDNLPEDIIVKIDKRGINPANYVLYGFESTVPEPFDIALEFNSPLTASQKQIMELAAKSVASLIGKGLPTAMVDGKLIDDLNIKISTTNLDGLGGTQARTKIDFMRYGTLLPAQSLVQFDAADIAELERSGQLFDVVRHEFLHALGFGNLWEAKGLVDYAGTSLAQYNGQNAVEAFQKAGGLTDAIALETEGDGSAGLHWNEHLFGDELMSHDINFDSVATGRAPLSEVTIASLADLGYEVNVGAATSGYEINGGIASIDVESLSEEGLEALRQFAAASFEAEEEGAEYIAPIMPEVDPATVSPEIWAHAERFWKNGEYYDWVPYQIRRGDTLSHIALWTMGSAHPDNYRWIAYHNGIPNPDYIVAGNWIQVPQHHPNYAWKQEQERLRREAELRQRQEEEARRRREQEERLARERAEQERKRREEEARRLEAERKRRELEEQERRLRAEMERRRQEEERRKEEERLREAERQREIARQQGKGGQDWFFATPLPEFGPVDPFETRLTSETVGNLVPDDYYRFTLSRGGRITAELKQLLADADLVLYDVRNRPIAYSMREGITDEQIIADLIPGTYMLRVNSPGGVTTDYDLIVKFQHLLSMTQKGPPPGWKVGGGTGSGSAGGSSLPSGASFADPRIEQIYKTALNNFETAERAKANAKIQNLEAQKRQYEQELKDLLAQMNNEQRAKIHAALDGVRDDGRAWVDSVANPIKGDIDGIADGIISQIESKIPGRAYEIPKLGEQLRGAKDSLKGAINGARSWLKGKIDWVQNQVKDAIWNFVEFLKNSYKTGAEINGLIDQAAQDFNRKIEGLVGSLHNWVGEFKGKILGSVGWLRNVGVDIPSFGIGQWKTPGFKWNFYDSVVEPLANNLANGVQDKVNAVGNLARDAVNWIKPRTQQAVAAIADAIFGDKTGHLYNKIHGVDAQIAATRTATERAISNQASIFKRLLDNFVKGLGNASNFVVGALMGEFNSEPSIWQTLLDTAIGMIPIVGEIGDVRDLIAYTKKFISNPAEIKDAWNWIGVVGAGLGLIPVVGGAIKGVTKVARNADFVQEIRKLGPSIVDAIVDFTRKADWTALSSKSKKLFDRILSNVEDLLRKLNDGIRTFDDLLPQLGILQPNIDIDRLPDEVFFTNIADNVRQLRRQASTKIDEGFTFLKGKLDEVGTLSRKGTSLRKNLGYPTKVNVPGTQINYPGNDQMYQAHHLIPVNSAENSPLTREAIKYGYDINSPNNGIFLPIKPEYAQLVRETTGVKLPVHSGSHEAYSGFVKGLLSEEWDRINRQGKAHDSVEIIASIEKIALELKEQLIHTRIFDVIK
ncbi:MAG TPA: AHH domain-containing protein, partial [Oscillatoriales cyanobacterium M4454_W2019_049]|nr:AHH domain-containing protein [Oscillatoriales cyanobacterium M4454_W2019_049]